MTDITGVTGGFEGLTGISAVVWGYVLGAVVFLVVLIAVSWAIGGKKQPSLGLIIICAAMAIALNVGLGWWDPWMPIFVSICIFGAWYFTGGREGVAGE